MDLDDEQHTLACKLRQLRTRRGRPDVARTALVRNVGRHRRPASGPRAGRDSLFSTRGAKASADTAGAGPVRTASLLGRGLATRDPIAHRAPRFTMIRVHELSGWRAVEAATKHFSSRPQSASNAGGGVGVSNANGNARSTAPRRDRHRT